MPVNVPAISGGIDSSNFQAVPEHLDKQIAEGAGRIRLNFQDVAHVSSAGLRVVHNLFNKLRDLQRDIDDEKLQRRMSLGAYKSPYLKLTNLAPHMVEVFSMGGFEINLEFHDETDAVNSF